MKKSNLEDAEYGLFAKQFIPASTLFVKYSGVLISGMKLLLEVSHYRNLIYSHLSFLMLKYSLLQYTLF